MPVASGTSLQACLNLVRPLDAIAGQNSPQMVKEMLAVPNALKSPQNIGGLEEPRLISNDGKTLKYQLDYFAPNLTAQTGEIPDVCGLDPTANGTPKVSLDVTLTKGGYRNGKVSAEAYRALCESPVEVLSFEIMNAAHEILKEMSLEMVSDMAAACGTYISGTASSTTPKTLNLINSTGILNPAGALGIKREFDRHGITPLVLGGRTLQSARDMQAISNRAGGVGYEPDLWAFGMPIWSDFKVDEALAALEVGDQSYAIAWAPGSFRLLEGYNWQGVYEELQDPRVTKTTTEIYGYTFDLFTKYDPECSAFIWQLSKRWDLFAIPEAQYVAGQNYKSKLLFGIGIDAWTSAEWTT